MKTLGFVLAFFWSGLARGQFSESQVGVMGQLDDVSTITPAENELAPWRITAQRAGHVNLRNTAGTEVGTSGAPLRTDPTGTTTQPVSGTVTSNQGTQGTSTSPWYVNFRNAAGTEIGTAAAPVRTDPTGTTTQPVSVASLPLPSGAATEATLAKLPITQGAAVGSNSGPLVQGATTTASPSYTTATINPLSLTLAGALRVDGSAVTQPISAASLPLPAGAATSALQTTGNTTLTTISGQLPATLGAKTTANSLAVNIASDQTVPVSASSLPLPTGASTAANQSTEITALQILDDVPAAMNAAFSKGDTIMGQLDDTSTTTATEDNVAPVRITAQRAAHTNLRNVSGTEIGTSGAPIRTDPTGTTTQPVSQGTAAALSGAWPVKVTDGTNTMPTMDAVGRAGFQKVTDGTNTAAVKAASTAPVATDPALVVVQSPNGNQATAANQSTEITALQLIDNPVGSLAPGTAGTSSYLAGCVYNSAGVTLTNGQQAACQVTATGALRVDADFSKSSPSYSGVKARYIDMNVASGGVARGTGIASTSTYTVLFNYSGTGNLFAFLVGFEGNLIGADNFIIKLEIDSTIIFEVDTNDIGTANLYNLNAVGDEVAMGFSLASNVLRFTSPKSGGLYYASSVKVSIKKGTSATSKQFRAGSVYLTKET